MIKNFKNNTLTDSLVSGAAAIALITGVGIAATPAQAGTLEWDNGTSNFFDQVDFGAITGDPTISGEDTFSVTFSPDSLGGEAAVFIASDEFAPFFNPPELVALDSPATANFSSTGNVFDVGGFLEYEYQLTNNLTFDFGEVEVTIAEGTTFLGENDLDPDGNVLGVEFEEEIVEGVTVDIDGTVYDLSGGSDGLSFVTGEELTFGQAAGATEGGSFAAEVVVEHNNTTPEPATILGLLAVGGLGLGLKRKKQSKQLSA